MVLMALCMALGAQTASGQSNFEYGIGAGVNSSTFSGENIRDVSRRTGVRIGGFIAIGSPSAFTFAPELWYCHKGATMEDYGDVYTYKLESLELDMFGQYQAWVGTETRFRIFAGPFLSLKLSMRRSLRTAENTDADLEGDMNYTNSKFLGGAIGTGIDFSIFRDLRMRVDFRYELGLTSLPSEGDKIYDRTLALTMGVSL
jgi:hypothetical protein